MMMADAQDACMVAADRGQSLRDEGKLIAAREQFLVCARDPCASVITKQCAAWLQKVDDQMPTVAFRAKGADGKDITLVHVLADGKELVSSIDGQPVAIDPGVHAFTYRHEGDADMQEQVVVRAGEKNRPIDIQFAKPADTVPKPIEHHDTIVAPAAPKRFRIPAGTWISAGVGVAGVVTMGVLVGVASSDRSHLQSTCAPSCDPTQVDDIRTKIVAANVALGVGIAAIGVATLWLILANTGSSSAKAMRIDPVLRF